MGYTHYWYRPKRLEERAFALAVEDCRKVCAALPIPLGDHDGEGEPIYSADEVAFNGHVKSGEMMPQVARVDGLLWPTKKAEGVAGWIATEPPEAGCWFAGPVVSQRALPESGDGSYETFMVERELNKEDADFWDSRGEGPPKDGFYFGFCKTNFRPYDFCVQCCLIVFKEHFGGQFKVRSDGDAENWKEACDICQHVLGYGLLFTLDEDE